MMETELKTIPALTAISVTRRLKLDEIPEFGGTMVTPLYEKLSKLGIEPTGDVMFVYRFIGEPMDCTIAVPIAVQKGDSAPFEFKQYPELRCLSTIYKGSMLGINKAWEDLGKAATTHGFKPTVDGREIYIKWVDFESPENITELQAGIQ